MSITNIVQLFVQLVEDRLHIENAIIVKVFCIGSQKLIDSLVINEVQRLWYQFVISTSASWISKAVTPLSLSFR